MKHTGPVALAIFFIAGAAGAQETPNDYYVAARMQNAHQEISGQQRYSPRAQGITRDPDSTDRFSGSLALGRQLPGGWRLEAEYAAPVNSSFDTQWRFRNPANGFVGASRNVIETRSQRLMFNVYKDFALSQRFSLYGGVGLGWSRIEAEGYQNATTRRFGSESRNNLAWSATAGVDYRLDKTFTLGMGYRYVDLGQYRTGRNNFTNAANRRDEQHGGRLKEQNLFAELRAGF